MNKVKRRKEERKDGKKVMKEKRITWNQTKRQVCKDLGRLFVCVFLLFDGCCSVGDA